MKHGDLQPDVRYATPWKNRMVPAYVVGMKWTSKGEWTGDRVKQPPRGRSALMVLGLGADYVDTENQARQYTDARHLAATQLANSALGTDPALDALLFPADGWLAKIVTPEELALTITWDAYLETVAETERNEVEKRAQYRKLRTHMLRVVRERNSLTKLGENAAPEREKAPKVATPAEVRRDVEKRRALKKEIAELEVKKREASEVSNYQRAVQMTEQWLVTAAPEQASESANLAAHDLVLTLSALLQDEPRTISARRQHAETAAAKDAMWERWRKGTDGNGYDWLGGAEQDPHHVIDVLLGLLIDRGWRPMEPTS